MKRIRSIILIACMAAALSATAAGTDDGYRPMIRQDRTWEYLWTRTDASGTVDCVLFRMKFDGTEEKSGKEYYKFVYCGDRIKWSETTDYQTGTVTRSDTVTTPNKETTVYYLREEPGKVFILFPYDRGWDFVDNGYKVEKGEEILLYDFTLSAGESFIGFWSSGDFAGGLIDYPVRKLDPVRIAGEECRTFGVTDKFQGACRNYRFAEEAGCLNHGTLAAPDAVLRTTGMTDVDVNLEKIYDSDGKIIYDSKMASATDIVDNSKSWNYNYLDRVLTDYKSLTPGPTYSFGDIETIEGTEYRPLLCDGDRTKVLMRQEDGKVYMRIAEGESVSIHGYPNNEDYNNRDLLVYDLGAAKDDTFFAVAAGEDNTLEWAELRVVETGTMPTLSGDRSFVTFARLYDGQDDGRRCTVVDGIGSISGCFYATDLGIQLAGDGFDKEILYDVTGKDGKVLYKGKPFTIGRDMVADDRVWEYYYSDGSQSPNSERELYRWKFSGTEEKEGRTWNRLVSAGSVKWRGSDPATAVTDDTETVVALLRQEDNRVWILDDAGERLMYDFNLQPRDEADFSPAYLDVVYEYRLDDITYKYSDLGVSGFYNFSPCGETSHLAPFTYSSNWGNVGRGDMLNLEFEEEKEGAPVRCLRNVYDLDGKVLYKGADIEVPPFAGIAGMGKALEMATEHLEERMAHEKELRDYVIDRILKNIPEARLNGGLEHRLPGNVNISFPGLEGETILLDLDMHGICASTGSACNSDSLDPSHVLLSIGVPEEIGHGSMRFTFGPQNTMEEAKYLCDVLEEVIPRRRAMSCMWLQGQNTARHFSLKGEN